MRGSELTYAHEHVYLVSAFDIAQGAQFSADGLEGGTGVGVGVKGRSGGTGYMYTHT